MHQVVLVRILKQMLHTLAVLLFDEETGIDNKDIFV